MMRNSPDISRLLFVGVGIVARIWFPIFLSSVFCDFRLSIRIEERIRSRKGRKQEEKSFIWFLTIACHVSLLFDLSIRSFVK